MKNIGGMYKRLLIRLLCLIIPAALTFEIHLTVILD